MKAFVFSDVMDPAPGNLFVEVHARISMLKTEEGGKTQPFTKNYRPNHNFGGPDNRTFYIGEVEVPEGTWVHPGETRELVVKFWNVKGLAELLTVGRTWRIQEGGRHVATAEVLSIAGA